MFDLALMVFLLISPILLLPSIGNLTALQYYQYGVIDSTNSMLQLQFFQFGVIGLFIMSLFQRKVREYKDFWLSMFLAVCLINIFINPISITMTVNIFLGFMLYKLVIEYTKNVKLVLIPIVVIATVNTIFSVLQVFNIHLIYNETNSVHGLMKISSHLGAYQALSVPILAMFNPMLAIIPLIGLVLSKTSTALIGAFVGGCYLLKHRIKNIGSLWVMLFMSLSALFIVVHRIEIFRELCTRIWIWKDTVTRLSFLGVGFCQFERVFDLPGNFFMAVYKGEVYYSTYSTYLYIIYSLGILAVPIFIWVYNQLKLRNQDRVARCLFASSVILLTIGLGQSFMEFPRIAGTAIVIFGLLKIKQGGLNGSVKV